MSLTRSSSVATCHTCSYCITSYKKNTTKWCKWYYFDINKVNNKYYISNASVSLIIHFLFLPVLLQIILCITNFHFQTYDVHAYTFCSKWFQLLWETQTPTTCATPNSLSFQASLWSFGHLQRVIPEISLWHNKNCMAPSLNFVTVMCSSIILYKYSSTSAVAKTISQEASCTASPGYLIFSTPIDNLPVLQTVSYQSCYKLWTQYTLQCYVLRFSTSHSTTIILLIFLAVNFFFKSL